MTVLSNLHYFVSLCLWKNVQQIEKNHDLNSDLYLNFWQFYYFSNKILQNDHNDCITCISLHSLDTCIDVAVRICHRLCLMLSCHDFDWNDVDWSCHDFGWNDVDWHLANCDCNRCPSELTSNVTLPLTFVFVAHSPCLQRLSSLHSLVLEWLSWLLVLFFAATGYFLQ